MTQDLILITLNNLATKKYIQKKYIKYSPSIKYVAITYCKEYEKREYVPFGHNPDLGHLKRSALPEPPPSGLDKTTTFDAALPKPRCCWRPSIWSRPRSSWWGRCGFQEAVAVSLQPLWQSEKSSRFWKCFSNLRSHVSTPSQFWSEVQRVEHLQQK